MAYGDTLEAASSAANALVLRTIADRNEHGEATPDDLVVSFDVTT